MFQAPFSKRFPKFSFSKLIRKKRRDADTFGDLDPSDLEDAPENSTLGSVSANSDSPPTGFEQDDDDSETSSADESDDGSLYSDSGHSSSSSTSDSVEQLDNELRKSFDCWNHAKLRQSSPNSEEPAGSARTRPSGLRQLKGRPSNGVFGKIRSTISKEFRHPCIAHITTMDLRNRAAKRAWICRKVPLHSKEPPTLRWLKSRGFRVIVPSLEGCRCVLDIDGRIIVVLSGSGSQLMGPVEWKLCVGGCVRAFRKASATGAVKAKSNGRGVLEVINAGLTHNNGTKQPINHSIKPQKVNAIAEELLSNPDIKKVAAEQDYLLRAHAPKLAKFYQEELGKLLAHDPTLRMPFDISIYPSVAFNIDSNTVCLEHTDKANFPSNLCAITAFGNYDHKRGGHLIIYDLKLVIEFPPGFTILIPSAALRHGNVAIRQGESRYSLVQYCPGGPLRWVAYGFRSRKSLLSTEAGRKFRDEIDGPNSGRLQWVVERLSLLEDLTEDQQCCFPAELK